jgi:cytochrome P450
VVAAHLAEVPYLDLNDPQFAVASPAVLDAREQSWYARTNVGLAVLRYEEVGALLKDRRLRQGSFMWPQQNDVRPGPLTDWWSEMLLSQEGETHRRLRKIANPIFSARVISELVPRFQALANSLIDEFVDRGECEFISEFARPYAARVLTGLFGLPDDDWDDLAHWSAEINLAFNVTIARDLDRIESALASMYAHCEELIAERRQRPGEDVVSRLVGIRDEGGKLNEDELLSLLSLLIVGGMDTTMNQLGLSMQLFIQHPDQWRLLGERAELAGNAIEEVMRFNPTVTWITRMAVEDFTFRDLEIKEGTTLHLLSIPANTDPRAIGDPRFDITKERPSHYGFGGGAHHCVGNFLARIDMREALPLLARRLREPRFAGPLQTRPPAGVTGVLEMPITFTPGA